MTASEPGGPLRFELDPDLDDAAIDELVQLWTDVSRAGGAVGFGQDVSADDVRPVASATIARIGDGGTHLIVARVAERPIGLAFLEQRPGPLFRHWATVKRLQIHPTLQGRGLGAALLRHVHTVARDLGLEQLHLTVRGGSGTETFYAREGYEVVARIPGVIRLAPGDDRDELYMITRL